MVDHGEGGQGRHEHPVSGDWVAGVLVDCGSGGAGREHTFSGYGSVWVEVDLVEGDESRLPVEYIG